MTPNKCIEQVDSVKPNAYGEEDKFRWINDLEGMVQRLVWQAGAAAPLQYPDDGDTELLIPYPFEDAYILFMEAMIDYHNREWDNYNNSVSMFYTRFDEYKKAYIRENLPKGAGRFKVF